MNRLSTAIFLVIGLFSIAISVELKSETTHVDRPKRGLFGPGFGLGFKSSILESKFGKGGFPFAPLLPVQPAVQPGALPIDQSGALPAAQPTAQSVAQPLPMIPTFLQNILTAKQNIIAGKFAAKQPPAGSFGYNLPENVTLEDIELAEEYMDPATASKDNIIASILKLSGPPSSSSSVEDIDE